MMCKHEGTIKPCRRREDLFELEDMYLRGVLPTINLMPEERFRWDTVKLDTIGNGFDILWGICFGVLCGLLSLIFVSVTQPKVLKLTQKQWQGLKAGAAFSSLIIVPLIVYCVSTKGG